MTDVPDQCRVVQVCIEIPIHVVNKDKIITGAVVLVKVHHLAPHHGRGLCFPPATHMWRHAHAQRLIYRAAISLARGDVEKWNCPKTIAKSLYQAPWLATGYWTWCGCYIYLCWNQCCHFVYGTSIIQRPSSYLTMSWSTGGSTHRSTTGLTVYEKKPGLYPIRPWNKLSLRTHTHARATHTHAHTHKERKSKQHTCCAHHLKNALPTSEDLAINSGYRNWILTLFVQRAHYQSQTSVGSKSTNNRFISFTDRIFIISQTDKVLPFDQDDIISESWPLSRAKIKMTLSLNPGHLVVLRSRWHYLWILAT